jgi:macrolide-specific efflux system membrane fusion protein
MSEATVDRQATPQQKQPFGAGTDTPKGNSLMRASLTVLLALVAAVFAFRLLAQTAADSPAVSPEKAVVGDNFDPHAQSPSGSSPKSPADSPPPAAVDSSAAAPAETPVVNHCIVSAIEDAQVSAKEAGVITAINVREGQLVSKGDLLAQIDDAQPQMEKRKAMAEKNAAQVKASSDVEKRYDTAAAEVAKYEFERNEDAARRVPGSVVQTELNRLRLTWKGAELKIEQADLEAQIAKLTVEDKQVEVDAADEAINRRQVRTPQDGIVEHIGPHVGEWVKPGDSVMRVVRIDRLQVEGYLRGDVYDPSEVSNRPVTVYVNLPHHTEPVAFTGRIIFVDQTNEAGNTFRVKASVENRLVPGRKDEWLLHPGKSATMRVDMK